MFAAVKVVIQRVLFCFRLMPLQPSPYLAHFAFTGELEFIDCDFDSDAGIGVPAKYEDNIKLTNTDVKIVN